MKKILKYINAILFLAAFGMTFSELAHFAMVKFSLFDLIKIGMGKPDSFEFVQDMAEVVQESIRPATMLAVILVALIWAGIVLSVFLYGRAAYICSGLLSLVQMLEVIFIYLQIRSKLEGLRAGLDFFGLGDEVRVSRLTVGLWCFLYVLIIVFSVMGIVAGNKAEVQRREPLMPEQIGFGKSSDIGQLNLDYEKEKMEDLFTGAILGTGGKYFQKAYPLKDRSQIFFAEKAGEIFVADLADSEALASVYYIREYREYCVEASRKGNVFLRSGQPLGAGRLYYLPRGTEIYIIKRENSFILG